jgi:hypothetical protein
MRACFLAYNVCALGNGMAVVQMGPLPELLAEPPHPKQEGLPMDVNGPTIGIREPASEDLASPSTKPPLSRRI